jgi:hypothetical protein
MNAQPSLTKSSAMRDIVNQTVHVNGITKDNRALRLMDDTGQLIALVPVGQDADAATKSDTTARLLASAGAMFKVLQSVLSWDERQEREKRLPRQIERRLISALDKAAGHV